MKPATLLAAAVALYGLTLHGQQTTPIQTTQPPANAQPCTPQPGMTQNVHPENIKPLNKGLSKLGGVLSKTTGGAITAPSAADISKATKPAPAPCPAPAVTAPPPAAPAVQTQTAKPAFVCPPKSTLIPNYPYCIYPDNTVVDAIPLPANRPVVVQH
jgi:hypothetical protein